MDSLLSGGGHILFVINDVVFADRYRLFAAALLIGALSILFLIATLKGWLVSNNNQNASSVKPNTQLGRQSRPRKGWRPEAVSALNSHQVNSLPSKSLSKQGKSLHRQSETAHHYDNDASLNSSFNNINSLRAVVEPIQTSADFDFDEILSSGESSPVLRYKHSDSDANSLASSLSGIDDDDFIDVLDGSELSESALSQRILEEKIRIKQALLVRRANIISQPMLEKLNSVQKPTRPKKIAVGRKPYHHHNTYSLNSANLFTNIKSPIITSAKVNPSFYIPTNVYGYYKEEGSSSSNKNENKSNSNNNGNNISIVIAPAQSPKSTSSPPTLASLIGNESKSAEILALESFLVNNINNNSNESNDSGTPTAVDSSSLLSVSDRKGLVSSNYSMDSSIQLRSANDGIKTGKAMKSRNVNMHTTLQDQQEDDDIDEIDSLYNRRLNSSTNSTMSTDYQQQQQQQIVRSRSNMPNLLAEQFATSNDSVATNKSLEEDEEEDYCGSDIDGEDFSSVNIDYNERFQEIMEDLRNVDCNAYQHDRIRVNSQFIALTQDFVYASSTFGKVIISERYLPNNEKTIPPIDIGGLAGGDKFIVHGILFKFAIDKENFYGSDYAASCVAGHELKGLINIFNLNSDLSLPLMALVDYRGFRVIAMSILPVAKDTICYGSNDYGMNIHNSESTLSDSVQEIARQLNIKSHHCGEQATYLHSPADLEGHMGFDGRQYLLDFARLFPPEAPKKGIKMGHLYRLLRPEFVRNYKLALCSDSFSRFIRGHNDEEHNSETVDATMYLLNTTIPELAEELNHVELNGSNIYSFPLSERLHKTGVNIRYLGHVRQLVESPDMKSLIFVEMCARVIKQQLRQKLRFKMKQAKIPLDAPYRRLIVAYLNRILGVSDKSDEFWDTKMKKYIMKKFDRSLFDDEINGNSMVLSLFSFEDNLTDGKYLLFKRIQKMTGLKFTSRINEEFQDKPNCWLERGEQPLDINDLEEIGIRVKYVPFMNVAQGYLFKVKGEMLFGSDPIAANRFFNMALEKLETALETDPNNTNTLCTMGEVYTHLGVGNSLSLSTLTFSLDNPYVAKAYEYLQRAIFSNRAHTTSLFRFAQLLERLEEFDRAEEYYIASLESNPNNIACLQEYGNFLQTARHDPIAAEPFFVRVSENHQYLHVTSQKQTELNLRGSSGLLKVRPKMTDSTGTGTDPSAKSLGGHSRSSSTSSISSTEMRSPPSGSDRLSTSFSTTNSKSTSFLQIPKLLDKSKSSTHLITPPHLSSSFPSVKTPGTPPTTPKASNSPNLFSTSDCNISPIQSTRQRTFIY